jgi:hypothetical protein
MDRYSKPAKLPCGLTSIATFAVFAPRWWRGQRIRRQMLLLPASAGDGHNQLVRLFDEAQSEYFYGKIAWSDFDLLSRLRDHLDHMQKRPEA